MALWLCFLVEQFCSWSQEYSYLINGRRQSGIPGCADRRSAARFGATVRFTMAGAIGSRRGFIELFRLIGAGLSEECAITDSRFSVDWFRYGGNRPEAEKRMSTRRARPIRPGRAYPCRSWGSPRAVSITLQPTSGRARFNRASNILQRGNILPNPLRPRHRCRPRRLLGVVKLPSLLFVEPAGGAQ